MQLTEAESKAFHREASRKGGYALLKATLDEAKVKSVSELSVEQRRQLMERLLGLPDA
jgi:hypothetical protein